MRREEQGACSSRIDRRSLDPVTISAWTDSTRARGSARDIHLSLMDSAQPIHLHNPTETRMSSVRRAAVVLVLLLWAPRWALAVLFLLDDSALAQRLRSLWNHGWMQKRHGELESSKGEAETDEQQEEVVRREGPALRYTRLR